MSGKHLCRLAALGAILLATALRATADTESPTLTKYRKPVEQCVDKALAYLAKTQVPPGQPLAGSFESPGRPGSPAITSLCVMAFLSNGHTPGTGTYGEVINRGIDFVLATYDARTALLMRPNRAKGEELMYSHCIGTLMLAEVSGMVDRERQRKIDAALPKALKLIVLTQRVRKAPKDTGGWRYYPDSRDSDLSLTGWAIMALRSGRLNGAAIPKECIDKAKQYIMKCQMADGGFAYRPGSGSGLARTGLGVLVLELCGDHGSPQSIAGGEYILRQIPRAVEESDRMDFYSYGIYYGSQAMFQLGGKYWETWASVMYNTLLKAQLADGAWPVNRNEGGSVGVIGSCYSTAMAVLALTVSYRQLPIYQR